MDKKRRRTSAEVAELVAGVASGSTLCAVCHCGKLEHWHGRGACTGQRVRGLPCVCMRFVGYRHALAAALLADGHDRAGARQIFDRLVSEARAQKTK